VTEIEIATLAGHSFARSSSGSPPPDPLRLRNRGQAHQALMPSHP
jgi:hypothetical protein